MNPNNGFCFSWFIDNASRNKASVKFEIKLLEARLYKIIGEKPLPYSKQQQVLTYCTALAEAYTELLKLISPSVQHTVIPHTLIYDENLTDCLEQVVAYKKQLLAVESIKEEIHIVFALRDYYKKIESLLQANESSLSKKRISAYAYSAAFKDITLANTPHSWLHAMINYANGGADYIHALGSQLAQLSDDKLLYLNELIEREDFVLLINTIFFYKINPCSLYDISLHPEKIISVKNRLTILHQFIEFFQQNLLQSLRQRGITTGHDYLFHNDELPDGIIVEAEESYKSLITEAIKDCRLAQVFCPNESLAQGRLLDLVQAYKFRFNPNRLVDVALVLKNALNIGLSESNNDRHFKQQLRVLYHQLSTTECLDLYGYFSNKDTAYLMRTLQAAYLGYQVANVPLLNPVEQERVSEIYFILDNIMNVLREELEHRSITTNPYERQYPSKEVKPGRRNLQALRRILSLYAEKSIHENTRLNQLFQAIESS